MPKLDYKIFDMLSQVDLNGTQFKIVMAVIYHMKDNPCRDLSVRELSNLINIHPKQISREIQKLFQDNILIEVIPATKTTARVMDINTNYHEWKLRPIEQERILKLVSNDYTQ